MDRIHPLRRIIPLLLGASAMALAAPAIGDDDEEELEFEEMRIYLELNDTDEDLGIHGLIDGDAWRHLTIENDDTDKKLLRAVVRTKLRRQGLTEFFFESAEPTFDELDPDVFFNRFPEGEYEAEGITTEGEEIEGEWLLSHTLAGPPDLKLNGEAIEDGCPEDAEGEDDPPFLGAPYEISWSQVTMSHPELGNTGIPVNVLKYEFVFEVERDIEDPPEDADYPVETDLLKFVVDVLPESANDMGYLTVALPDYLIAQLGEDDETKFEIVTQLDNGNQTATEACVTLFEDE